MYKNSNVGKIAKITPENCNMDINLLFKNFLFLIFQLKTSSSINVINATNEQIKDIAEINISVTTTPKPCSELPII